MPWGVRKRLPSRSSIRGGDYVLALKGNQGLLADEVEEAFIDADANDYQGLDTDYYETDERGHGRVERRRYWTLGDTGSASQAALWTGLNMFGMVESIRECDGKTTSEYRFYIGSIGNAAKQFARAVRGHWGVENCLHWRLDIAFREDESRLRERSAAENFAVLRHIALGLLKNDTRTKLGVKNKRLKAGWDERYLGKLLFSSPGPGQ
jgi:predicted transposase YbfD/YdcC